MPNRVAIGYDGTMSKPRIVAAGHPVLREKAADVPEEEIGSRALGELIRKMIEAMRAAPGVGLAAPQLGIAKRIIVLEDVERHMAKLSAEQRALRGRVSLPLTVVLNPVVTPVGDAKAVFFEGCLSVPGYMALVERFLEVDVVGLDERGEPFSGRFSGWPARIFQHEGDHLDGALYVDRMMSRTFGTNDEVTARWLALGVDEVREKLAT